MKSNSVHTFYSFIGMLFVLLVAFMGDRWLTLALLRAQNSFDNGNLILFHPLGQFLIVGACLFLYWVVIQKSRPQLVISLLYIGGGLLLSFYNIAVFQFPSLNFKTINFLYPRSSSNLYLTASVFITLIGVINFFRYRILSK